MGNANENSHLLLGLNLNVLYGIEDIRQFKAPREITNGCNLWKRYANSVVVDQPDSGLRI